MCRAPVSCLLRFEVHSPMTTDPSQALAWLRGLDKPGYRWADVHIAHVRNALPQLIACIEAASALVTEEDVRHLTLGVNTTRQGDKVAYMHQCAKCGSKAEADKSYPRIVYENVE